MALREVGFEVEAVERAVLPLDELLQPPPDALSPAFGGLLLFCGAVVAAASELPRLIAPKDAVSCQKALLTVSRGFLGAKPEAFAVKSIVRERHAPDWGSGCALETPAVVLDFA